ncbi:hypothetical protein AYI69_g6084 [Smittium culicis]|uniref:Uncharacterized protein n=1 Tax=Smittium culicis TaxID=133412 RepID=A0A1R1Y1C6_9FUNG|nr:hypothetical protein AYI69_g6084 [Smittium culicis]
MWRRTYNSSLRFKFFSLSTVSLYLVLSRSLTVVCVTLYPTTGDPTGVPGLMILRRSSAVLPTVAPSLPAAACLGSRDTDFGATTSAFAPAAFGSPAPAPAPAPALPPAAAVPLVETRAFGFGSVPACKSAGFEA